MCNFAQSRDTSNMVSVIKLALRGEDAFFIVSTVLRNQSDTFNVVSVIKVYIKCGFCK